MWTGPDPGNPTTICINNTNANPRVLVEVLDQSEQASYEALMILTLHLNLLNMLMTLLVLIHRQTC